MSLRNEILEKVPDYLKEEPEFKTLLDYIKANKLKEKETLLDFLGKEIATVEKWLAENKRRGGTAVKSFRDKAVKLGVLRKCKEIVKRFLD